MARKNRRKGKKRKQVRARKPGVQSIFPRTLFGILFALTVCALGYLYLCGRCDALGKNIYNLERELDALKDEIVDEEYRWANMTSPENMEKLLAEHNLTMIWPSEDSVRRLRRNPPPQLYAHDTTLGTIVHD